MPQRPAGPAALEKKKNIDKRENTMEKGTGTKPIPKFGIRDKLGYMMGDAGCNFSFSLISGYMMIFFTQYIGITLDHYALIILLVKIWDGINDPLIGAIADRFNPKGGSKFRPWIFWGSIPLAFSSCLLFLNIPSAEYWVKMAVCIVGYMLWDIAYTVVNVPYGSLNSTITADPVERAQLSTWRSLGAMVAAVPIAVVLPLVLFKTVLLENGETVSQFQGQRMFTIALVLGIVSLSCFQLLYRLTTERVKHSEHDGEKFNWFKMIKGFFTNRTMIAVSLTALVSILFMNSSQQTGSLVYQMYFGNGQLSVLAVLVMLPMLFLLPLVKGLVKRFGKKNLCSWPLLLGVAVYIVLLFIPNVPVWLWIACQLLATVSMALYGLLGWALVSDGIDSMELQTGRREEGSVYATYSMLRKLGQGLGQAMIPFLISRMIPGLAMDDELTWSMEYGLQIKNISVALCLIGFVLAFILMRFVFDIDKKKEFEMPKLLGRDNADVDVSLDNVTEGISRRED